MRISLFVWTLAAGCGASQPSAACEACPTCVVAPAAGEREEEHVAKESVEVTRDTRHAAVKAGGCSMDGVPEPMRIKLSDEQQQSLLRRVEVWLNGEFGGLRQKPRAGIYFAKSEDDTGADPPYPTTVAKQSRHACGLEAEWLLSAARQKMRIHAVEPHTSVQCQDNVCCYEAFGEYDSSGGVVLQPEGGDQWRIEAVYEVADNGALAGDYVQANYKAIREQLDALRKRTCKGEPEHPGG